MRMGSGKVAPTFSSSTKQKDASYASGDGEWGDGEWNKLSGEMEM